jgi:predicted SpoU family rRNA methylase
MKGMNAFICLVTLAAALGTVGAAVPSAQSARKAEGVRPDLNGVWDFSSLTPLQRQPQYEGKPYLIKEEAENLERQLRDTQNVDRRGVTAEADLMGPGINEFWLERGSLAVVDGRIPTSLIIDPPDGRIPAPTVDAQRRIAERQRVNARADTAEDRSVSERCLHAASGPPYLPSPDANTLRIVQSPTHIALTAEKFHETRIVRLGGRHVSSAVRTCTGDSVGRWEGDTLIVDTTNFSSEMGLSVRFDGNLHLTERFRRVDQGTLRYEVTIEDATAFVAPWTVVVPMQKVSDPLYEFACHEGNYALGNILRGARVEEQRTR